MLRTMYPVASACLALALIATSLTSAASAVDWRDIAFPVKSHDFGTRAVAAATEFRFPVVNTFSSDMHIQSIRASCGCTTPIIENEYIQPGTTGYILAKFNTDTFRGEKGATLTVVMDKPFYSEIRLEVKGYIRSDVVFHPGSLDFGSIDQSTSASRATKVLYAGRSDWRIVNVRANKPWLIPTVKLVRQGQGKVDYELTVAVREDAPKGMFRDDVIVTTNDGKMTQIPLPVTGNIESALTISPQSFALGSLKPGQSVSQRLVVKGREPFTIESITAKGWKVSFDNPGLARSTHLVNATFMPTDAVGPQKIAVEIKTGGDSGVLASALLTANVRDR